MTGHGGSVRAPYVAALTAPGQPFQVAEQTVRGIPMRVFDRDPRTLRDLLRVLEGHGDRTFTVYDDEQVSFAETARIATGIAHELVHGYGLQKGDRVGVAMRNYPEWAPLFFGIVAAGLVIVPLNAWWTPDELVYAVGDCGPKVVFADPERVDALTASGQPAADLSLIEVRGTGNRPGVRSFADLLAAIPDTPTLPDVDVAPDDDATILYTSGTTGRPKGAVGTHRNHITNVLNTLLGATAGVLAGNGGVPPEQDPAAPQPGGLCTFPLFHIAGITVLTYSALAGARVVLQYRWDPAEAVELVRRHRLAGVSGVPTVARQFVEAAVNAGLRSVHLGAISIGGAAVPPGLIDRIDGDFASVISPANGYGLTETTSAVVSNAGPDYVSHPDSVGRCQPGADLRIVDPATGDDAPEGAIGELWFRGPNIVRGYWNNPEATAAAFTNGWFHTGDLGRLVDGWVYVVDRIKDVIIRGGENIYCAEVEALLLEHPAVADAALVGVPHDDLGEEAVAVVNLREGHNATAEEIQRFVAERLAAFKVPAYVVFRAELLPRTPSGKILKRQLREPVAAELGRSTD